MSGINERLYSRPEGCIEYDQDAGCLIVTDTQTRASVQIVASVPVDREGIIELANNLLLLSCSGDLADE